MRAAWQAICSIIAYMKPSNCASATGRMPCAARPTLKPAIEASSSGVSITRLAPNFCCRPAVARNTPPLTPTSSPSTTTDGSRAISWARAMVTPSIRVICGIVSGSGLAAVGGERLRALAFQVERQFGVGVIEHRAQRLRLDFEVGIDLGVRARVAVDEQFLFLRIAPCIHFHEVGTQALERLALP